MKAIKISRGKMSEITAVKLGGEITFTDGDRYVALFRSAVLNPEEDSPELEEELLKAAEGPFTSYSHEELRRIGERVIRKHRAQRLTRLPKQKRAQASG